MKRRDFVKKAAGSTAGVGVLAACGGAGEGATPREGDVQGPGFTWSMATSYPSSLDILHGSCVRFAERVGELTGGNFRVRVYPANEIVGPLEVMTAVQRGTVQMGYTPGYYYVGHSPALAFDTSVPFGFNAAQQAAWFYYGGGLELLRSVYDDFGIVNFPSATTGLQWGGWFRRPVNSMAELRGLRIRIPGIGGEVLTRMGASVQNLGAPDIYPALERGAIDAVEWVGPHDDEKLGFYQAATNFYAPGWWEPGPSSSVLVGRSNYDTLPPSYQHAIAVAAREQYLDSLAHYDALNPPALDRLVNERGVSVRMFSDDILETAWRESNGYLEDSAVSDATFRRVYESFKAFRDRIFPYYAGNEAAYARFAYTRIPSTVPITT